jgi:hypothetical protein
MKFSLRGCPPGGLGKLIECDARLVELARAKQDAAGTRREVVLAEIDRYLDFRLAITDGPTVPA